MSQVFELNPIRKLGANGVLESIGLEWTEEASWRYSHRPLLYVMVIPVLVLWVIVGAVALVAGGGLFILATGLVLSYFARRYMWGALPRRSVVLKRDGKILVPHGIPANKKYRSLNATQPDVIGFEIGPSFSGMQQDWTSSVQMVTKTGATVTVSKVLHREEAREVVVGLNVALAEMRKSVGTEPMRKSARSGQRVLVD